MLDQVCRMLDSEDKSYFFVWAVSDGNRNNAVKLMEAQYSIDPIIIETMFDNIAQDYSYHTTLYKAAELEQMLFIELTKLNLA